MTFKDLAAEYGIAPQKLAGMLRLRAFILNDEMSAEREAGYRAAYEQLPVVRLEYLREQIQAESISYGEIAELQGLADQIDPGDATALPIVLVNEATENAQYRPSFAVGQAELFQGDCLEWLRNRAEESITSVVTDPPYGLTEYSKTEQEKLRAQKGGGVWRIPPSYDGSARSPVPRFTIMNNTDLRELHDFFETWAELLLPALVPGAHVIVACNPLVSPYISMALADAGLERRGEIVRRVMTMRGGDRPKGAHEEFPDVSVMPRSQWEPWLVYRKPIACRTVADNLRKYKAGGLRRISDAQPFGDVIISHPTNAREKKLANHPSLKPQSFLRQVVRASLPLGEGVVCDPFAGSGSTLAAAEAVGYSSVGVELDQHYVDLARLAIPKLAELSVKENPELHIA